MKQPLIITLAKHRVILFCILIFLFCLPLALDAWIILESPSCNLSPDIFDHNIDFLHAETVHLFDNTLYIIDQNGLLHIMKNPTKIKFTLKKEKENV